MFCKKIENKPSELCWVALPAACKVEGTIQQAGAGTKKSISFSPQAIANAGLTATPTSNTTVATTATPPKPILRGQQSTKPSQHFSSTLDKNF